MSITRSILVRDDSKNCYLAFENDKLKCISAKGTKKEVAGKVIDALIGAEKSFFTTAGKWAEYKKDVKEFKKDTQKMLEGKDGTSLKEKYFKKLNTKLYQVTLDEDDIKGMMRAVGTIAASTNRQEGIEKIVCVSNKDLKKGLKNKNTQYDGVKLSNSTYKILKKAL